MGPIEPSRDGEALLRWASETLDRNPAVQPLEWRFEFQGGLDTLQSGAGDLLNVLAEVLDAGEDEIRGELHEIEDSEAVFIAIYTGAMEPEKLESLRERFDHVGHSLAIVYQGASVGEPSEGGFNEMGGDGAPNHDDAIAWTVQILSQTANWKLDELAVISAPMREAHLETLRDAGLEAAQWMPDAISRFPEPQLRSHEAIARRLMSAMITTAWIYAPKEIVPTQKVKEFIGGNSLKKSDFAKRELTWLQMKRAKAAGQGDQAGWITENIWSLAWLLGEAPIPSIHSEAVSGEIMDPIRRETLNDLDVSVDELVARTRVQPIETILALEDFLYCAHNALRSLALQDPQYIPAMGFVQERRQSLTWALCPDTAWDETDVST